MNNKIRKIVNYIKGINMKFAIYGLYYKFYNTTDNYSRLKYGKEKFLKKQIASVINKYKKHEKQCSLMMNYNKIKLKKFPIWFCWFQGIEEAPDIVKICLNSIQKNINSETEIHILAKDNIKDYINVPKYIEKKYEEKRITHAMYADFIRIQLLATYGGFWIDSTVLVTENISSLCNYKYYTKKSDVCELHFGNYLLQGRFAIHLLKIDSSEILINYLYDAMKLYFKKFDVPVDYYMTNMMVDIGYNELPEVKKMMDDLEINDKGLECRLCENLNNVFDENLYRLFCKNMPFQKLSHHLNEYKEEVNGKRTFYGYIKDEYL